MEIPFLSSVNPQAYIALAISILFTTCWLFTAHIARTSFPPLTNKRICLLIAHPDDEAMFFAPSVIALTAKELGNHIKILCLSSGNANGVGPTRKKELLHSASILGLRSPADVLIIDDPAFPDSMTTTWDPTQIATILSTAFLPPAKPSQPTTPTPTIDILLTFDQTGISSHPNHMSLYHGAHSFLHHVTQAHHHNGRSDCPVALYTLTSTTIVRKYLSVLDAPWTMVQCVMQSGRRDRMMVEKGLPRRLIYVSDGPAYRKAQRAMTAAHRSQMVWFRWGWIVVGRYMVVNDWRRERVG